MSASQPTIRSLTGLVTKLCGDGAPYGVINNEIFFMQKNVTGGPAGIGDTVFVECEYGADLPIKWNATSVKLISKGTGQPPNVGPSDSSQLEMNNQQQFNQNIPVAVTYQQHRQMRQQMDAKQQDGNNKQQQQQPAPDLTARLLDSANAGGFQGPNNASNFVSQQQQDGNIQPFAGQPMGPPNFTYTSQLGSAFVQSSFAPVPFLAQQPPLLPPQQQNLLPNNNQGNNQRQQNKQMGGRFNNQGDKNDRQNNNRRNNRNEKFDRPRSNERDNSQGNRQSKSRESRDRSTGRNQKRDDAPSRPSPPARSSTSASSDRGGKGRKHYEVQNIPKGQIMTNMNFYNMKQRCPSSVHVPSDLKDVIVNRYFRLDIKNIPKPLKYTIETPKKDLVPVDEHVLETKDISMKGNDTIAEGEKTDEKVTKESSESVPDSKPEEKVEVKADEVSNPPSSRSDSKLNHKYGVKIILISLPELESIYKSVFGSDLDSFNSESKSSMKLDETISLLCNRGSNNGYSLVGGKFDPILDGFVEGETNEFERHGRQPDLIATCKRVVLEQTGLDLGECRSWTLLSTFMYNHKSDYFSPKASIEYSFIYMPQIWTLVSDNFNVEKGEEQTLDPEVAPNTQLVDSSESAEINPQESNPVSTSVPDAADQNDSKDIPPLIPNAAEDLNKFTVADLKAKLDEREVKYKGNAKKAELVSLLSESLESQPQAHVDPAPVVQSEEAPQLEEGEVADVEASDDSSHSADCEELNEQALAGKRKSSDAGEDHLATKKLCKASPAKDKRVELVREPFLVRARDDQQQLTLVTLHEAALAARHDQFELSVASNILKESLVQHMSEYILTALVEDSRQKMSSTNSQGSSSQETTSDTNNNSTKVAFKNPQSSSGIDQRVKEYPIDRYVNLAFSYFDSTHMGYMYFDDLNKLFNNTGLTISKRALISLIGDGEKFNYRTLPDLSSKLPPTYLYEFPEQFKRLGGCSLPSSDKTDVVSAGKTIEYQGVTYNVEKLVQQVKEAETMRVSYVDRFNYAIENSDKQAEEIHVLEVSQKSLAKAIKAQNDEICDLKRERDSIKKKCELLRKGIKSTVTSLSDLVKDEK